VSYIDLASIEMDIRLDPMKFYVDLDSLDEVTKSSDFWMDAIRVLLAYHLKGTMSICLDVIDTIKSDLFTLMIMRYLVVYRSLWKTYFLKDDSMLNVRLEYKFGESTNSGVFLHRYAEWVD